ncbi:MAG TPA: LysR family transcriptional regulator substrate-binding protein, partial [Gammaproteobacteria bacterium]|nr:LysR family transcriptional regulator substrate-binding protein [Gammaproteobacteria bacterium]
MPDVPEDIIYQPLVTYAPALIVPTDHPLARKKRVKLEEISQYALILPPPNLATWRLVDMVFRQHDLTLKCGMEAGGWEVIKKYVEMGMGLSIVTDVCLTGKEHLVKFSLEKYFPKRTYGIVLRRGKYLSPQAAMFLEILHDHYPTGM